MTPPKQIASRISKLEQACRAALVDDASSPFATINSFLANEEGKQLLHNLGVYWGAFGVADSTTKTFQLFVQGGSIGTDAPECVYLPFSADLNETSDQDFFRFVFRQQRAQNLLGSGRSLQDDDVSPGDFAPEFYWYLVPEAGNDRRKAIADGSKSSEWGRQIYDNYLAHYCGPEEITAGLLAWRILFRYVQFFLRPGGAFRLNCVRLEGTPDVAPLRRANPPWDRDLWQAIYVKAPHAVEKGWLESFESAPAGVAEVWREFVAAEVEATPTEALRMDWQRLGLVEEGPEGDPVGTSHLRQVLAFLRELEYRDCGSTQIPRNFATINTTGWAALERCNVWIQRSMVHHLQYEKRRNTLSFLLSRLHLITRFPIVPYFYLQLRLRGTPCAHLVAPLIHSRSHAVEVVVPRLEGLLSGRLDPNSCSTSVVALGLYAIEPIESVRDIARLRNLLRFQSPLATVIGDLLFYGKLAREQTQALTERAMIEDLSHQGLSFFTLIDAAIDRSRRALDPRENNVNTPLVREDLASAQRHLFYFKSLLRAFDRRKFEPTAQMDSSDLREIGATEGYLFDALLQEAATFAFYRAASGRPGESQLAPGFSRIRGQLWDDLEKSPLSSPGRALLQLLKVGPLEGTPQEWHHTRGFVILYFHVLWQSLFHAFRHEVSRRARKLGVFEQSRIRIHFSEASCVVSNLAYSGAPNGGTLWSGPSERSFFAYCAERWPYKVTWPDRLEQDQWVNFEIRREP